jgi:hypothetical protein
MRDLQSPGEGFYFTNIEVKENRNGVNLNFKEYISSVGVAETIDSPDLGVTELTPSWHLISVRYGGQQETLEFILERELKGNDYQLLTGQIKDLIISYGRLSEGRKPNIRNDFRLRITEPVTLALTVEQARIETAITEGAKKGVIVFA